MSEQKETKFRWDDKALIPDSLVITFPSEVTGGEPETITHWELSRSDLVDFVAEAMDKKFVDDNDERIPFKDVVHSQETLLWTYMAKSNRGVKTAKFYEKLALGSGALVALVDAFLHLNHIDEIMASGGNWFMLPTIRAMLATSEAEEETSESQKPTLPA